MRKEDLRTGMRITLRNGKKSIILLGTSNGDIHSGIGTGGHTTWGIIDSFNQDLEHESTDYDIIKIEDSNVNCSYLYDFSVVWEREQTKELTMQEIADKFNIKVEQLKIKK